MSVKNATIRLTDIIISLILIILAISIVAVGSALLFSEQVFLACMALYILWRLKCGRSVGELNYILSFLVFIVVFYVLKLGMISGNFPISYGVFVLGISVTRFIAGDKKSMEVYRHPFSIVLAIVCIFFYLVSVGLNLSSPETGYLIPGLCLLTVLHLPVLKFNREKSKKLGLIFAAALICTNLFFFFRYTYSARLIKRSSVEKAKGDITAAISNCRKAVLWMPFYGRANYILAGCYNAGGLKQEAISQYQKGMDSDLSDRNIFADTYIELAELYLDDKRWKDVYILLSRLIGLTSEDNIISSMPIQIKNLYDSILFEHKDRKKEAIDKLRKHLNIYGYESDDYSHSRLAKLYWSCGQHDLAISEYKEAINYRQDEVIYQLDLAYLYLMCWKIDKSIYQYSQVLKLDPDSFFALEGYINALLHGGYRADALVMAEQLVGKYPNRAIVHEILSRVYRSNGFYDKAVKEYKIFFKKTPVNSQTLRTMGDYYSDNCQYKQALKTYSKVLKLGPDDTVREIVEMLEQRDNEEYMRENLIDIERHLGNRPYDTSFLKKYWFLKKKIEDSDNKQK